MKGRDCAAAGLPEELILFRQPPDSLFAALCAPTEEGIPSSAALRGLLDLAAERDWQGDLWHCFLALTLALSENPFSLDRERREGERDSLWRIALQDMERFRALFTLEWAGPIAAELRMFRRAADETVKVDPVTELAADLAAAPSAEAMLGSLCAWYRRHGVGMLGLGQLFRLREGALVSIDRRRDVRLDDLIGYEEQKRLLRENTEAFLAGRSANNVLLYGDAGTGKSTSIQALANEYGSQGLRIVELYKEQFDCIPALLTQIKRRNYRFLVLLDDLSFEESEVGYKRLKAVMEGGGEAAPENVLFYATSNRRHLVREIWADRSDMQHDGDIHRSDTMAEKLSLSGRFGLQIFYPDPSFEEYQTIVRRLAERSGAPALPQEELRALASAWQVRRGSRSGRTARQFVDDLSSRRAAETAGGNGDAGAG